MNKVERKPAHHDAMMHAASEDYAQQMTSGTTWK
jgi:hypothetical protein